MHRLRAILCCCVLAVASVSFPQAKSKGAEPSLAQLEKNYFAAKAAYSKHPKDAKAKKLYIDATVFFGHASMTSDTLPPRVRYPRALRLYREVLKLDPNNPVAKPESELIISVYKSMHRPIPK